MKSTEFYADLSQLPSSYRWDLDGNVISGTRTRGAGSGSPLNPVTALATYKLGVSYGNTKRDTRRAGNALGLTKEFADNVYDASCGVNNRGYVQIVRGRIRSSLGI